MTAPCPMHVTLTTTKQGYARDRSFPATERVGGREYCATCAAWMFEIIAGTLAPGARVWSE